MFSNPGLVKVGKLIAPLAIAALLSLSGWGDPEATNLQNGRTVIDSYCASLDDFPISFDTEFRLQTTLISLIIPN